MSETKGWLNFLWFLVQMFGTVGYLDICALLMAGFEISVIQI